MQAMEVPLKALSSILLLALMPLALEAQRTQAANATDSGTTPAVETRDEGVSEVRQSTYIAPIANAPFSAILHTEWTRPMAEGGSTTLVGQRRVARDSRGRIYEERGALVPKDGSAESRNQMVQIADPNTHILYSCSMLRTPHRCTLQTFNETSQTKFEPALGPPGPLPYNMGFRTHEDLGTRSIEGIDAHGTRDTTTYNLGVKGSYQQFSALREFWRSEKLGINLYSELTGRNVGKQTFTLTDVSLSEPDRSLFELPEGFAVEDHRKPAADPAP